MAEVDFKQYFGQEKADVILDNLFDKYDKDKNGKLSSNELSILLKSDLGMNNEQCREFFKQVDKNHDSQLSREELRKWLQGDGKFAFFDKASRYQKMSQALDMFIKYDRDQSRSLDIKEFRKVLCDIGTRHDKVESTFKSVDKDRNGKIVFSEFLVWLNWTPLDHFDH